VTELPLDAEPVLDATVRFTPKRLLQRHEDASTISECRELTMDGGEVVGHDGERDMLSERDGRIGHRIGKQQHRPVDVECRMQDEVGRVGRDRLPVRSGLVAERHDVRGRGRKDVLIECDGVPTIPVEIEVRVDWHEASSFLA